MQTAPAGLPDTPPTAPIVSTVTELNPIPAPGNLPHRAAVALPRDLQELRAILQTLERLKTCPITTVGSAT